MVTYPQDWGKSELGVLFDISAGGDVNKNCFSKSKTINHPYEVFSNGVDNRGLYGYTSTPLHEGNSITVTARGTIGKAFYRSDPYDAIIRLLVLVPKHDDVNSVFYTYFINNNIVFEDEHTGVPQLTAPKIKRIHVTKPSRPEQDAIAETLSCIDAHIANLSELIEKKKGIRDGALEDLVSGRTRLKGFDGEWENVPFNAVITPKARIGWQGLKKHEYSMSGYSYLIGGTDFHDGTVRLDNISFVTKERYAMDTNIQVAENDVLVTKDGTIGKVAIVPPLSKPATLNSGVFVFRTAKRLAPSFLYRVLSSSVFKKFIDALSAGSTIKHLYQKDLKKFEFSMPKDIDEQIAIVEVLSSLDSEISAIKEGKDKMLQIKAGAIDDLLTGRIRLTRQGDNDVS